MLLLDLPTKKSASVDERLEVFCVIEHAYRDLAVAEAVCSGRFNIVGVELELGPDIDWITNPFESDIEWQIEWHKFYYGLDMAYAYSKTGDRKFLDTWTKLVSSFIRQVPVEFASTDVLARRVQNWIYARQIFVRTKHFLRFPAGFENELLASIFQQTGYLKNNLTAERNHRTLELYALFIVALALPQLDPRGELLRFAIDALSENLFADTLPDGVQRELSTHYHCTVLRSFLGARENARRFGLSFAAEFDQRLIKACQFAMHIHRPDGQIPAISDSDTGSYLDLLKLAGDVFDRPDFTYAATSGLNGTMPETSNVSFKESGYFIQRSGWGKDTAFKDERFLMFDCGPIGDGGHGHYDLLNIEVAACGKPLIVDGGRYTYAEGRDYNWRQYFKGTAAHNTVVVDAKDQTSYRRGKPKGSVACGVFIERKTRSDLDVLCGMALSPNYEAVHTRRVFFVRNEFWLIADSLRGEVMHRYDLRFHLTPDAWNHCSIVKTENNCSVRTPEVALVFSAGAEPTIEPDWYAPQYGIKHRAPCVSVVSTDHSSADFYTLVVPLCLDEELPSLTVEGDGSSQIATIGRNYGANEILSWELSNECLENVRLL